MSLYDLDVEANTLGAYGALNRPVDQRGGAFAFSLPGELLGLRTMRTLADSASPAVFADVTAERRKAMLQYGGFAQRSSPFEDPVSSAFARRERLIDATSLNSPIYRAMMSNTSLSGLRAAAAAPEASAPGLNPPNLPDTAAGDSLYDLLKSGNAATTSRSRQEAWTLFQEKQYRQAARNFEAILVMESNDAEARIGEVFSYVAGGSTATAAVLVQQLDRRVDNPFAHDLGLRQRFAEAGLLEPLLLNAKARVDAIGGSTNVNLLATDIFVLWHLGDYETALRAAEALAKDPEARRYAAWPGKMRAALAVLPRDSSR